jgi:hypothetical protein
LLVLSYWAEVVDQTVTEDGHVFHQTLDRTDYGGGMDAMHLAVMEQEAFCEFVMMTDQMAVLQVVVKRPSDWSDAYLTAKKTA